MVDFREELSNPNASLGEIQRARCLGKIQRERK